MLCTAMSAWSQATYSTQTITLDYDDCDESYKTTDSGTGIYVSAPKANDVDGCWKVEKLYPLQMEVPDGYVITGVEFDYFSESYLKARGINSSGSIDNCDKLALNGQRWEQKDGAFSRITMIRFRCMSTSAYVRSVTITYHKHTFTHHGAVAATCVATGMKEYWECSDCGHIYSNESGASEATMASLVIAATNHKDSMREIAEVPATCVEKGKMHHWHCDACGGNFEDKEGTAPLTDEGMVIDFNPTNHPDALEEHARVEATCTTAGNVQYWHCNHCNKDFSDKDGTTPLTDEEKVIDIEPANHPDALEEHARVEATCTTAGNVQYWHCNHCNRNFGDKDGTTPAINDVTIPATNHKNKTFTEAVAPTADKEGNVAYWHCPDCDKYFGDEGCTNELTEWTLEKLVNVLHLDFAGTSAPIETEHYMDAAKFNFTDDGDIILTVNGESVTYDKEMISRVQFFNGTPSAKIKANEDPDNKDTYYSTFYSSLETYAVPEGFTAYRGEVSTDGTELILASVKDGVMTRGEGYILRGTTSNGSMEVTENADGGSTGNVLLGTDVAIASLGANDYALSLGQNGVGFYLWDGKTIGANKAYLTIDEALGVKSLKFRFDDDLCPTGIETVNENEDENENLYNLNGLRVGKGYKGIVIRNGKKVIR